MCKNWSIRTPQCVLEHRRYMRVSSVAHDLLIWTTENMRSDRKIIRASDRQRSRSTKASAPLSRPVFAALNEPKAEGKFIAFGYCFET